MRDSFPKPPAFSPAIVGALFLEGLDTVDIARRLWRREIEVYRALHHWRSLRHLERAS